MRGVYLFGARASRRSHRFLSLAVWAFCLLSGRSGFPVWKLALVLYAGGVAVGIFAAFSWWAYDDPFITFRYADNLRSGWGFVYNPGQRVLSTTTPLYTLVLTGLGFLWSDLPRVSNLLGAVSLALGGVALFLLGRRWGDALAGLAAMLLFPLFPLVVQTLGSEMPFYITLVLWALVFQAQGWSGPAMVLAGLATLTRPDGMLAALVLAGWMALERRRLPWLPLLLFGLVTVPFYAGLWLYFGSPFPVTLMVKQHQAQMAITERFAPGFIGLLRAYVQQHPPFLLSGGFVVLGLFRFFASGGRWAPLLAWSCLYFAGYAALGVPRYFWYYAPLAPTLSVLVGCGLAWAAGVWPERIVRRGIVGLVLVGLTLWPQIGGLISLYYNPDPRIQIYRQAGLWLNRWTPEASVVGALEVGIIGYYARRPVVDFAGLTQPEVAHQMHPEASYQDLALWAIDRYRPAYVVIDPGTLPAVAEALVRFGCVSVREFVDDRYRGRLVIYRCNGGSWGERDTLLIRCCLS